MRALIHQKYFEEAFLRRFSSNHAWYPFSLLSMTIFRHFSLSVPRSLKGVFHIVLWTIFFHDYRGYALHEIATEKMETWLHFGSRMSWLRKNSIVNNIVVTLKAKKIYRGITKCGVQNESPHDVPQWCANCFELKTTLAQAQEKLLFPYPPPPLSYLEEFQLEALPIRVIRDNFFWPTYRAALTSIY